MANDPPADGSQDDTELSLHDLEVIEDVEPSSSSASGDDDESPTTEPSIPNPPAIKGPSTQPPPRPRAGLGRPRAGTSEKAVVSTLRDGAPPPAPGVTTPTADRPRAALAPPPKPLPPKSAPKPIPPKSTPSSTSRLSSPGAKARPGGRPHAKSEANAISSFVAPAATPEAGGARPEAGEARKGGLPTVDASAARLSALCEAQLATENDVERKGRLHYELGRLYEIGLASSQQAADHYQSALRIAPDNAAAIQGARRALAALGRHPLLAPLFDAEVAVTREPIARARLLSEKAALMETHLRQPGPALAVYREALALDPGNVVVLKAIERGERRDKSWPELAATYAQLANAVEDAPLRSAWTAARAHLTETQLADPVQAASLYQVALDTDPHATGALAHVKRLGATQRQWAQLIAALRKEHELATDEDARQLILVAIARVQQRSIGDADAAEKTLREALATRPEDRSLLGELVRHSAANGRHAQEAEASARLFELTEDTDRRATLAHRIGWLHEQELGDGDAARPWYERALGADPAHRASSLALGRLLEQREDWTGLLRVWAGRARAISATDEQADLHHRMGILFEERLGRANEAATQHAHALGLDPAHHGSFEALARLLAAAARWHELAEIYERAIDRAPHDAEAIAWLFRLGGVFEDRLDDAQGALAAYERILQRDPASLGAMHAVRRAAERAGRFDRVVEVLGLEASSTKDAPRAHALMHRAAELTLEQLADAAAAARALEAVLARAPVHRASLETLARLKAGAGQWEELIGLYERLLPLTPSRSEQCRLWFRVGQISETQLAKDAGAIAAYRRALEIDAGFAPADDALLAALARTHAYEPLSKFLSEQLARLEAPTERARAATELGALFEEKLNDRARAISAYEQAVAAVPTYRPALDAHERLLTDAKDPARLAKALEAEAATSADPFTKVSASLRRALALGSLADKTAALEAFRPVFGARPDHLGALLGVEDVYAKAGDDAGLVATYERMATLVKDPKAKLAALSELARARGANDPEALSIHRRILELAPHDVPTLEVLVAAAEREGDSDTALTMHARLATSSTDPMIGAYHQGRVGEILLAAGDANGALSAFRAALSLDPKSLGATRGLSLAASAAGDTAAMRQAARYESQVTRDSAVAVSVLLEAAQLAYERDLEQEAASAYQEALLLDPDNAEAAMGLMATMMSSDGVPRIIELHTQAAQAATDSGRVCVLHLTVALLQADIRQDLSAAVAATRRALGAQPKHRGAYLQLASYLERNGQWVEALEAIERSLEAAEGETKIELHLRLARIADKHLQDPERAKVSLRAILATDENRPEALTALARIERLQGHDEEALRLAKKLISVVQDDEQKAAALAEMAELEKGRGQLAASAAAAFSAIGIQGPMGSAARLYRGLIPAAPDHASWEMYSTALMTYLERAKSKRGDIAATYRELARVFGESRDRPDRAISTLREGVAACPHDASISIALVRALRAARSGTEALAELRRFLAIDVLEVGAWRALAELVRETGEPEGVPVALTPLVVLGQATDEEERTVRARRVRAGEAPAGILGESGLKQLLESSALDDPAAAFIPAVGEIVTKLEGIEYEKWGVQKRDRIRAGEQHHLRSFADRIGRIFGVPEFDLFVSNASLARSYILSGSPPALIIPASLERARDSVLAFHLARPLALLSRQLHALDHVDEGTLERILVAVVRQFDPAFSASPMLDEDEIEDEVRRVGKAIGFFSRGRIQEAATLYASDRAQDFSPWAREIRRLAARAALLISDDLISVLGALGEDLGPDNYSSDLVRFWVSDPALRFRRVVAQQL